MKSRIYAALAAGALVLAGCTGGGGTAPAPGDQPTSQVSDNGADPAESALTSATALRFCIKEAKSIYTHGFEVDTENGEIETTWNEADQTWFLKYNVTVTDREDKETEAVMECTVSGTESAPYGESLYVY